MLDTLLAVAQQAAPKVAPKATVNTPAAQNVQKVLPSVFPDFTNATPAQYVATVLDVLLVLGLLGVLFYALTRPRKAPSPYEPPAPLSPEAPDDPRPSRAPHQVLWSGFMVRVLVAFSLMVTVVILFNCVTSGLTGTLILALLYGYLLRLLWPMISDQPRAPIDPSNDPSHVAESVAPAANPIKEA